MRAGLSRDEATRQARAAFGGVERYKDDARDAWPLRWLSHIAADVRFALRSLARSPSFTATATIALALGMSANTIVFGAADAVAFRPLAVRAPERLVALYGAQGEATLLNFSYATFGDVRRETRAFEDVAAVTEAPVTINAGDPTTAWAAHVSDNYFSMLGVVPASGRFIRPGELAAPVAVLGYSFWVAQFARDPSVVGRTIRINGAPFTIVGIAPAQFSGTRLFTYEPSVWLPVGMHRFTLPGSDSLLTDRGADRFLLIARLRGGIDLRQAHDNVNALAARLAEQYPVLDRGLSIQLISNRTPINPWLAAPERLTWIGRLLVIGVSLVLLIACANVASLLLARMSARREEIAIRLSLGASRGRVLQQLMTESLVLAALGAVVAVPVSMLGARGLVGLSPHLDYASSWRPADDARVIGDAIISSLAAAVIFGLAPAMQTVRRSVGIGLRPALPLGRRRRFRVRFRVRFRELILVAQAALSVTVLTVAMLLMRSLRDARRIDPGFELAGAATFTLDPQLDPSYDAARTRALYANVTARLAALPPVIAVSRAAYLPLDGNGAARRVFVDGGPTALDRVPVAEFNVSAPGYFRAIGTPIVAGRDFTAADSGSESDVVVINDVLARRLWPGESAIGKHVRLESAAAPRAEVVGVARSSKYRSLGEPARAAIWRDLDRAPRSRTTVVVRTSGDERTVLSAIRAAVRDIDPALPVIGLATLREHVSLAYSPVLSGAIGGFGFGALALLLTVSGVCGLVAYTVSRQRREIGIRAALGARPAELVRMVVARAVMLSGIGVAIGLAVVVLVPMGLEHMLYGLSAHDPVTLAIATLGFCGIAAVAALAPAVRAVHIDPMTALRLD
jgi:predicted permease